MFSFAFHKQLKSKGFAMGGDIVPIERVIDKIHVLLDHKVMLDQDLAALYGVETRLLVRAVKRNMARFPDDFMFQLNKDEFQILRSQIGTSSWGGRRFMPFVFTEQGVAMLSSVLNSERAVQVNIAIMRGFVALRKLASNYADLLAKIESMEKKYDSQFKVVFDAIRRLMAPSSKESQVKIGFKR